MKVRIVKCSGNAYWYKDSVGATFRVSPQTNNVSYFVEGCTGKLIDIEDAEIVAEYQAKTIPEFPLPDGALFIGSGAQAPLSGYSTATVRAYSDQLIVIIKELRQELAQHKTLVQAVEQQTSKVAALLRHYERSTVDGYAINSSTTN